MSDAPAVSLRGLVVDAPTGSASDPLLGPLDLDVARGEHALVVGPSGSGKTTLLRAIAGLAPPSAGRTQMSSLPERSDVIASHWPSGDRSANSISASSKVTWRASAQVMSPSSRSGARQMFATAPPFA